MKKVVAMVSSFVIYFTLFCISAFSETEKLSGYESFEDTAPLFALSVLEKWDFNFEGSSLRKMYDETENIIYLDLYMDYRLEALRSNYDGFVYDSESLNEIEKELHEQMDTIFSKIRLNTPNVVVNVISSDNCLVETHATEQNISYLQNEEPIVYTKCNEIFYLYDTSSVTKSGLNEMKIKRMDDVFQPILSKIKINGAVELSGFFSKETEGFVVKLSLLENPSEYASDLFDGIVQKVNEPISAIKNLFEKTLGTKEIDFYEVIVTKDKKICAFYKNGEPSVPVNCALGHYFPQANEPGECMVCSKSGTNAPADNDYPNDNDCVYSSSVSEDYKAGLYVYAKELVSTHLKSPSTAQFPNYSVCDYQKGEDGVYFVVGYVDSQNSFGAMIRENWGCMIQEVGTKWKAIMVQIGENIYFD